MVEEIMAGKIKEVSGQYNPEKLEKKISEFWEKNRILQKLVRFKPKRKFYLLDGPPYVNQIAHVGHVKTTTAKDIWARFKLMQGFNVWLQPGFDCHGLPIEVMVEKELGIKSKKEIEQMGIDKFIKTCRGHAEDNKGDWLELYHKLAALRGWLEPYLTYKNYYIESGWWTIKRLFEKGMLVAGEKPIFWCPKCQTALSGYEVTDSYRDVRDPSIYAKFPVIKKENEFILIWTTTPWTLVGNVAIAVHPEEYYVRVKVGKEVLILAEKRLDSVKGLVKKEFEVQEKFLGKDLEGLRYHPVLNVPVQQKLKEDPNAHRIILSMPVMKRGEFKDFVTMEEGSGCVHSAPGHGPEDHIVGKHYNLPVVSPVDDEGKFTNEAGEFRGLFVKDADKRIVERLEKRRLLLHFDWIVHAYPLCWRCKSPLIYRLSRQWFFKVDTIKEKMMKENEKVHWLPEWGKTRFRNWLAAAIDWCISQQRFWGIPLPIWICEKCKAMEVIGSVDELRKKVTKKLPKEFDLHRHVVDGIELTCGNCGSVMRRVRDTMNVWFDSGISPWASLGYPFKNKELFESLWPMDLVCESQDQIRGWFYSLMFCGMAAFDQSPYRTVALMGWVLDEKGEKMSKSLGNVIWAGDGLKKLGADILRLYYCWEVPPWETQKFSFKTAEEIRKAVNILWNSYSFFTTYCMEKFKPLKPKLTNLKVEDRWILSKINGLIPQITNHLENFEFHYAGRKLMNFIMNDLSRFYIKLIRNRVWVTELGKDKQAALSALYEALAVLSKLLAPIAPYISEEIYQNLVSNLYPKAAKSVHKSVHMSEWPKQDEKLVDDKLEELMEIAKKMIDASYSARQLENIKLRWPVRQVVVVTADEKALQAVKELKDVLLVMCNAKSVKVVKEKPAGEFAEADFALGKVLVDKKLDEEILEEALIREIIRKTQSMRKEHGFHVRESINLMLNSDERTNKTLRKYVEELKKEVGARELTVGKLEGEFKAKLKFEGKTIDVGFSR